MTLNKTYEIQNKPIKDILEDIDKFVTNMSLWNEGHPNSRYDIDLVKFNGLWSAKITIANEKQEHNKTLRKTV